MASKNTNSSTGGGKNKGGNGPGTSKGKTLEQHAEAHEAAKRRKAANKKPKGFHDATYFYGRQAEIQERRDRARAARERHEAAEQRKADLKKQAILALDDPTLGSLEAGTPAAVMALKVIQLYPDVEMRGESRV